jgi:hypothetical protein
VVWIGWLDLLTICAHHLELHVVTALPLISTLYSSPRHLLSFFPACCVFTRRFLATVSNSGDSSASRSQVLLPQPPRAELPASYSLNWTGSPSLLSLPCRAQLHAALVKSSLHSPTANSQLTLPIPQLSANCRLSARSQWAWDPRYIDSGRTQQKTPLPNSASIAACVFVAAGTCLPSRCLAMDVYSCSIIPAFRRHMTIYMGGGKGGQCSSDSSIAYFSVLSYSAFI